MIDTNAIRSVMGAAVYDTSGDKIGKVGQVYLDSDSGRPVWASVNTGLFGTSESFVPLHDATWDGEHLRVGYEKSVVTDAPRIVEVYGPGPAGKNIVVEGKDKDDAASTSVSFNGFGQRVGTGTLSYIDISHADASARKLRIQITPSGGIRMCDRDVVAPDPRACV